MPKNGKAGRIGERPAFRLSPPSVGLSRPWGSGKKASISGLGSRQQAWDHLRGQTLLVNLVPAQVRECISRQDLNLIKSDLPKIRYARMGSQRDSNKSVPAAIAES